MKLSALCAACLLAVSGASHAQVAPDPNAPLTVHPVRDGVYWVEGGVANTAFVVTDAGVVAFDAQMFVPTALNELAAIARITDKPVVQMILSHSDPDHVLALPAWGHGPHVVAQENDAAEIRGEIANPTEPYPWADLAPYLPGQEVGHEASLNVGGVSLLLLHVAPAHTDGDLVAYLPAQRIVLAGDILTPGIGPFPGIHLNKHGSSLGWILFAKALLKLDADVYISGHGEPLTRAEIQQRVVAAETRRTQIAAMVARGMTLDQIKAAFNDPPPTGYAALFPTYTETTYEELTTPAPAEPPAPRSRP